MSKDILIADIGATNARLAISNGKSYSDSKILKLHKFNSLIELIESYLEKVSVSKAIIGVAAPIMGDQITFINSPISFSISKIKNSLFPGGLEVFNDLELQAYALEILEEKDFNYLGETKEGLKGPKLLVSPGTGLGLAGLTELGEVISTEAGHLNVIDNHDSINILIQAFLKRFSRYPTYEDILSGKGIEFVYESLMGPKREKLNSEKIISNPENIETLYQIKLIILHMYATFLRSACLMWGALGGVYLSGSITNSLFSNFDTSEFRKNFQQSKKMKHLLKMTPLIHVARNDLGYLGAINIINKRGY